MSAHDGDGLSLTPFRALRPAVDNHRLGAMLCPPYDVIDEKLRTSLLAKDPDNAVAVILPRGERRYEQAAARLNGWASRGLYAVDDTPALYIYEMTDPDGQVTRGVLGAVQLRDPADGVILPHENTMAGPVADRLALMLATEADVEPIYLVYDGGGPTSQAVATVADHAPVAEATTADGLMHRLWALRDPAQHDVVAADLAGRSALIADGHHRYATYREAQRQLRADRGAGPWDRGLALLVDTTEYGPQVHAIHRVLAGLPLSRAVDLIGAAARVTPVTSAEAGLATLDSVRGFGAVLADARSAVVVDEIKDVHTPVASDPGDVALTGLDVTVLHRVLVRDVWHLDDTEDMVEYAHSVDEAIARAREVSGVAVLLRATPVAAVAEVAAAGARMPRKSTLFTPKPASGLVMRRFSDR